MNDDTVTKNKSGGEDFSTQLKAFRAEIDALDEKLIELILRRSAVVTEVGKLKANAGEKTCPLRPAREAAQLKKLTDRFAREPFPAGAAAHVWRHIINGSLAIEGGLSVGVCSPVGATSDLVWMAREYFGPYAEMMRESQPRTLMHKVASGQCAIGVMPYPNSEEANPWWIDLLNEGEHSPAIFLKLPFLPEQGNGKHGNTGQALAIAKVTMEPYEGQGISAVAIRAEKTCSMSKLQDSFKRAGLAAHWVSVSAINDNERAHFVEVEGDVDSQDARFEKIREAIGSPVFTLSVIGHYAQPLNMETKK